MNRLLKKVTDLEEKVTTDVNKKPERKNNLLERLQRNRAGTQSGQVSDNMSNNSSDKVSSAKQLLGSLFKGKRQV